MQLGILIFPDTGNLCNLFHKGKTICRIRQEPVRGDIRTKLGLIDVNTLIAHKEECHEQKNRDNNWW